MAQPLAEIASNHTSRLWNDSLEQTSPTQPNDVYTSPSPAECRASLLSLVARHQDLLNDAIRGIYKDRFFHSSSHNARRLHKVLNDLTKHFESALLQTAGLGSIVDSGAVDTKSLATLYPVDAGIMKRDDGPARMQKYWYSTASIHLGLAQDVMKSFMEESLAYLAKDENKRVRLTTTVVDPHFATQQKEVTKKLDELLRFYSTPRGERALSGGNIQRHITSFVDQVIILIQENILLEQLPTILTPNTICSLTNEGLRFIAGAPLVEVSERTWIQHELGRLASELSYRREPTRLPRELAGRPVALSPAEFEAVTILAPQTAKEAVAQEQMAKAEPPQTPNQQKSLEKRATDETAKMDAEAKEPAQSSTSSSTDEDTGQNWLYIDMQAGQHRPCISFGTPTIRQRPKLAPRALTGGFAKYNTPQDSSPFSQLSKGMKTTGRVNCFGSGPAPKFELPSDLTISGACAAGADTLRTPLPKRLGGNITVG